MGIKIAGPVFCRPLVTAKADGDKTAGGAGFFNGGQYWYFFFGYLF